MKLLAALSLALLLTVGGVCAGTVESIRGRLEKGPSGEAVLTLDLAPARFASLADKAGRESEFDRAALGDLIRERFHYLLRLRTSAGDLAPTSIALALPPEGAALPEFVPLTATWAGPDVAGGWAVTQSDVPNYRVELAVVDKRVTVAPPAMSAAPQWLRMLGGGMRAGIARLVPGGILPLLFMLGLCFSARDARELVSRLVAFSVAHGVMLGLGMDGVVSSALLASRWIQFGIGASLVAVAAMGFVGYRLYGGIALALFAGVGGLHGLGMVRFFTEVRWLKEGRAFPGVIAAVLSVELALVLAAGAAALLTGTRPKNSWCRPEITVPASIVIGLSGLVWTVERMSGIFSLLP